MGWISKKKYVPPHDRCDLPVWDHDFGDGSTYMCDTCGNVWVLCVEENTQLVVVAHWKCGGRKQAMLTHYS